MLIPIELAISNRDARVAANLGINCTWEGNGKHLNVAKKPYTTMQGRQATNP